MPKPVPPPPPQPTVEQTRAAVRLVRITMVVATVLFAAVACTYGSDNFFLDYGRSESATWNLWRAEHLDMVALRAHPGGRVTWLVGSSILRDAFDEAALNEGLAQRGSPWRVRKFGFTRGAPGLSAGLLDALPVAEGDRVVTTVSVDNFRAAWEDGVGPPADIMMLTVPREEFWDLRDWTLAARIEQASAIPWDFYRFHDEIAAGVWSWIEVPLINHRAPHPARRGWALRYNPGHRQERQLTRNRAEGAASSIAIGPDGLDFSEAQFNVRGLERFARTCAGRGAEFRVVHVPPRQEYMARFVAPEARAAWDAWRAGRPDLSYLPQLPEDQFYDWKHPMEAGRARLTEVMLDWLDAPTRGTPTPVDWPLPETDPAAAPPPGARP